VKAGHVDSENVISGMDWLPTLARIAGVTELPAKLDGEDVTDIWLGATRERTSPLFWKTSTNRRSASMRHGNWKLHLDPRGQKGAFLYDLSRDPSESNNVAGDRPNVRNRLVKKLDAWMDELPDFYEKTEGDKKERKRKR
jgi:N-acetylgalactosamine-6-sulfatase